MAYMSQEKKATMAPAIKAVLKKYGIKGSIAVHNSSTLVVNIKSGEIDFIANFNSCQDAKFSAKPVYYATCEISVNPYWYDKHFAGRALEFFEELFAAMNEGNHNRSDVQTDYFDVGWYVGWYVEVNVGSWDKPYQII